MFGFGKKPSGAANLAALFNNMGVNGGTDNFATMLNNMGSTGGTKLGMMMNKLTSKGTTNYTAFINDASSEDARSFSAWIEGVSDAELSVICNALNNAPTGNPERIAKILSQYFTVRAPKPKSPTYDTVQYAVVGGQYTELIEYLNRGFDVNARNKRGEVLLLVSVCMGDARLNITQLLVMRRADVNAVVNGKTILEFIRDPVYCDNKQTIAYLVSQGAMESSRNGEQAKPASSDSFFRFNCLTCGKRLKAEPQHSGKKATCPKCKSKRRIPAPDDESVDGTEEAGEVSQQEPAISPEWKELIAYFNDRKPCEISTSKQLSALEVIGQYYTALVNDPMKPKITYYVLKSTGVTTTKFPDFPIVVVATGTQSDFDKDWNFEKTPILNRALPGKTWDDFHWHGAYANHSKPGCNLASTAPYDQIVLAIKEGKFQLECVMRPGTNSEGKEDRRENDRIDELLDQKAPTRQAPTRKSATKMKLGEGIMILRFPRTSLDQHQNHVELIREVHAMGVFPALRVYSLVPDPTMLDASHLIVVTGRMDEAQKMAKVYYTPEAENYVIRKLRGDWSAINAKCTYDNVPLPGCRIDLQSFQRELDSVLQGNYTIVQIVRNSNE